jgi:hypothetical protein
LDQLGFRAWIPHRGHDVPAVPGKILRGGTPDADDVPVIRTVFFISAYYSPKLSLPPDFPAGLLSFPHMPE